MDDFEKRLKDDAAAISADVSQELRGRIDATLGGIEQIRPAERTPETHSPRLWLASSLTGLAAAVMVIVLLNWDRAPPVVVPEEPVADLTVPADPVANDVPPELEFRTADFTSPLEEELTRLKSDLEKARDTVTKDLGFTF